MAIRYRGPLSSQEEEIIIKKYAQLYKFMFLIHQKEHWSNGFQLFPHAVDTVVERMVTNQDVYKRQMQDMSKQHVGALIAVQRSVALGDIIETGTRIEGAVSAELIETIFRVGTCLLYTSRCV